MKNRSEWYENIIIHKSVYIMAKGIANLQLRFTDIVIKQSEIYRKDYNKISNDFFVLLCFEIDRLHGLIIKGENVR